MTSFKILSLIFVCSHSNSFVLTDVNYFLGALPFLAAVDSGILGVSPDQVKLLPPPKDQMKFCYDVSSCLLSFPEKMNKWNLFYQVSIF